MPLDERDAAYLLDILQAAQKVQQYVQGKNLESFKKDDLLQDAVERNIEIIGEAARKISEPFKQDHTDIPWRKIIAQRNVLIHQYGTIDSKEIWEVATIHLSLLIQTLAPLIPPLPPEVED